MDFTRKDSGTKMLCHEYENDDLSKIAMLEFPILNKTGLVKHGFSTRVGGVSEGIYSSMNLQFGKGDSDEHVSENFRRVLKAFEVEPQRVVISRQTHTVNVRVISEDDLGKGLVKPVDYDDVDGLITNMRGVLLVCYYADCVPLYFLDPLNRVIALSHSGWRGTYNNIAANTLKAMNENFGSNSKDIIACVGPSICMDCYEISEDLALKFNDKFGGTLFNEGILAKCEGHFYLDLWAMNRKILLDLGIPEENIEVTDICTACNYDKLFSHRKTNGKRGNNAALLMLK